MEVNLAFPRDERTPVLPSRQLGKKIGGRRQLDVDVQAFLQIGNRAQHAIAVGHELQIDVDRAVAPAAKDRGRAAGEVDAARFRRGRGDGAHELAETRFGYRGTHSAARSKLTSNRISAL